MQLEPAVEIHPDGTITSRVYARIGLLGNPSDGYRGKTIGLTIANFSSTVQLTPNSSPGIQFIPNAQNDPLIFNNIDAFKHHIQGNGLYGGLRLLQNTLLQFINYCASRSIPLPTQNKNSFSLSYSTNIPRQRGLSGSSAIVCATLNCLMEHFRVNIPVFDRPLLILSVERDLGITGGLQDRILQVYGGALFMDYSTGELDEARDAETTDGVLHPLQKYCKRIDPGLLPPLYIIYSNTPSCKDSGQVHGDFKERWNATSRDACLSEWMDELARLAQQGYDTITHCQRKDEEIAKTLYNLMRRNFELRRKLFGDAAVGAANIRMVDLVEARGTVAAKFCGSGGALVAIIAPPCCDVDGVDNAADGGGHVVGSSKVCHRRDMVEAWLMEICREQGLECERAIVGPIHHTESF